MNNENKDNQVEPKQAPEAKPEDSFEAKWREMSKPGFKIKFSQELMDAQDKRERVPFAMKWPED